MKSILTKKGTEIGSDNKIDYSSLQTLNQFTTLTLLFITNYGTVTEVKNTLTLDVHYTVDDTTNEITLLLTDNNWTNDGALTAITRSTDSAVAVLRTTNITSAAVSYNDSALLTDTDLNTTVKQLLFKLQELSEQDQGGFDTSSLNLSGNLNQNTNAITTITADNWVTTTRIASGAVTSDSIANGSILAGDLNITNVSSAILEKVYPVGAIYMNYNNDTDPAVLLNFGSWNRVSGKFVVGAMETDSSSSDSFDKSKVYDTSGGGVKSIALDKQHLPPHIHHNSSRNSTNLWGTKAGSYDSSRNNYFNGVSSDGDGGQTKIQNTWGDGADEDGLTGAAHQNLPPYKVVSMWYRVS